MTEIERARYVYWQYMEATAAAKGDTVALGEKEKCLRGDFDHQHGVQIAAAALSAQASRVAELEGALKPFLDLRHQSGAHGVISKKLDDMQPLTVTVTKAQFRAAFEALGREDVA